LSFALNSRMVPWPEAASSSYCVWMILGSVHNLPPAIAETADIVWHRFYTCLARR